jgi:hypothetical protein
MENQQDDADLRAGLGELLAGGQRQQPAVPEGQARQQVQRDRRLAEPAGQPAQQPQGQDDAPEFGEQGGLHRAHSSREVTLKRRATPVSECDDQSWRHGRRATALT